VGGLAGGPGLNVRGLCAGEERPEPCILLRPLDVRVAAGVWIQGVPDILQEAEALADVISSTVPPRGAHQVIVQGRGSSGTPTGVIVEPGGGALVPADWSREQVTLSLLQPDGGRPKPVGYGAGHRHVYALPLLDGVELVITLHTCARAALQAVPPGVVHHDPLLVHGRRAPGLAVVRVPGRARVVGRILVDEGEHTGQTAVPHSVTG